MYMHTSTKSKPAAEHIFRIDAWAGWETKEATSSDKESKGECVGVAIFVCLRRLFMQGHSMAEINVSYL